MIDLTEIKHFNLILVVGASLLALWLHFRQRIPKGLRLPPGPPGRPLIGNVFDMPTEQEWVTFSKWAKTHGELVYLKALGQSMIVISSARVAYELFEKRSSIYSDRSDFPMIDLMGWDWILALKRYGDAWRRHRRVIHQKFHPVATEEYQSIQLKHTRTLLRRMLEEPDHFAEHLRHNSGANIIEVVYGIKVLPKNDPYITTAEEALRALSVAGNYGTYLVDIIPMLKYVPEWFPGAGFKTKARIWRKSTDAMSIEPFEAVKKAINSGTAVPSITSSLLEELSSKGHVSGGQEDLIRSVGSTVFAGGADTTVTALQTFFLAMVLYPDVQRKAREELDEVVGLNRLPEYDDRDNLPYINALCKEVLRWHPVLPLGLPHRVTQDDVFEGQFIPAGTVVFGNAWTILRDEATFGPETDKFRPERFLVPGVKDPNATFGFGRRICPGRFFADNTIYIAVSSILSVFDIIPPKDSNGVDIPMKAEFESGLFSPPKRFTCSIRPRSDTAKKLILQGTF